MENIKSKIKDIKAIMCDVDGTILAEHSHKVLPETIEAIKKVREKGILFGLCTGRDLHGVKGSIKKWGLEGLVDAVVGTGGSEVADFTKDFESVQFPLEGELIKDIIKHYEDLDVNFVIPYKGILHAPKDDRHIRHLAEVDGVPYKVVDFDEFLVEPKQKLMIMTTPEVLEVVVERSKTFKNEKYKSASLKTASVLYEYMDPRISKTYGLKEIMKLHGWTLENLCSFGDADNDYDMTKNAGIGVVMGNGSEKTKSVADFITDDASENGIATFINKYFL